MRTGDHDAAKKAAPFLAKDVVVQAGQRKFEGYDEVLKRITGTWPNTPVYIKGDWSHIHEEDGGVHVHADMRPVGAGPKAVELKFSFNGENQITKVEQEMVQGAGLIESDGVPDFVSRRINNALANDTPLCVGYVNEEGQPQLSLRGSTLVFSPNQVAIWVRQATGGMAKSIEKNPNMMLLFRDSGERSTITFQGKGHIQNDDATRKKLWDMIPEVERNHETWESGAPLIIDLDRVDGGTPDGRVRVAFKR
jgi:hypothetical protein